MTHATSTNTITALRHIFSYFGLPEHLVTDNGTQFTSDEFQKFLRENDILHTLTAPGHPATNGLAERYVGEFKYRRYRRVCANKIRQVFVDLQGYTHRIREITLRITYEQTVELDSLHWEPKVQNGKLRFFKTILITSPSLHQTKQFLCVILDPFLESPGNFSGPKSNIQIEM